MSRYKTQRGEIATILTPCLSQVTNILSGGFSENEDCQKYHDHYKGCGDLNIGVYSPKIWAIHNNDLSSLKLNPRNNIPKNKSYVNTNTSFTEATDQKLGAINTTPNQAADRFIDNPDKDLLIAFLSFLLENKLTNNNLSVASFIVK